MGRLKSHKTNAEKQRAYRQRLKLRNDSVTKKYTKTILSLFDYSGSWSQPYVDAGYEVVRVDLKSTGQDVRLITRDRLPGGVVGVMAAPPCTDFALSGAWTWEAKGETSLLDALSMVDATLRIVTLLQPAWWVLENPVGRLVHYLGKPKMYFQPCDYGDSYTKKTVLWENFNNNLPLSPVDSVD